MAMTIIHVSELLEEATREHRIELLETADFVLPMGAGVVDPELIKPTTPKTDVEDVIAFRCSSL